MSELAIALVSVKRFSLLKECAYAVGFNGEVMLVLGAGQCLNTAAVLVALSQHHCLLSLPIVCSGGWLPVAAYSGWFGYSTVLKACMERPVFPAVSRQCSLISHAA